MHTQVYLFFNGRTEEALEFYKKTLGAEVEMLMRFKDAPKEAQAGCAPGSESKVMHSCFKLGDQRVMASDGRNEGKPKFEGFSLAITARDDAETKRIFNALADGGQVRMPLTKTFFASSFGMVADRFGIGWMVLADKGQ